MGGEGEPAGVHWVSFSREVEIFPQQFNFQDFQARHHLCFPYLIENCYSPAEIKKQSVLLRCQGGSSAWPPPPQLGCESVHQTLSLLEGEHFRAWGAAALWEFPGTGQELLTLSAGSSLSLLSLALGGSGFLWKQSKRMSVIPLRGCGCFL